MTPTATLQKCSICGDPTEWDENSGPAPLCVACWDARAGIDNEAAAYMRAYYQANKEKAAAYMRAYRQANKEKVAARKRAYYQANKEKAAAYMRAYYQANKEKAAARKRAYRQANHLVNSGGA